MTVPPAGERLADQPAAPRAGGGVREGLSSGGERAGLPSDRRRSRPNRAAPISRAQLFPPRLFVAGPAAPARFEWQAGGPPHVQARSEPRRWTTNRLSPN